MIPCQQHYGNSGKTELHFNRITLRLASVEGIKRQKRSIEREGQQNIKHERRNSEILQEEGDYIIFWI